MPYFFFFLRLNKKTTTKTNTITITAVTTIAMTTIIQLKSPSPPGISGGGLDLANNLGDVILLFKLTSYLVAKSKVDCSVLMISTNKMVIKFGQNSLKENVKFFCWKNYLKQTNCFRLD